MDSKSGKSEEKRNKSFLGANYIPKIKGRKSELDRNYHETKSLKVGDRKFKIIRNKRLVVVYQMPFLEERIYHPQKYISTDIAKNYPFFNFQTEKILNYCDEMPEIVLQIHYLAYIHKMAFLNVYEYPNPETIDYMIRLLGRLLDEIEQRSKTLKIKQGYEATPYFFQEQDFPEFVEQVKEQKLERTKTEKKDVTTDLIECLFRRDGDIWHIEFKDQEVSLKHSDGLLYIRYLLRNPKKYIHALELYSVKTDYPEGINKESTKMSKE